MKFVVLMRQSGQGCDYTIGCGYRWHLFDSPSAERAAEFALGFVREYGWRGDRADEAFLCPADALFDLAPLLDADVARDKREAAEMDRKATEAEERRKLAELRAKYPDG